MKKKAFIVLFALLSLAGLSGAKGCVPEKKPTPYTGQGKCSCKNIGPGEKELSGSTNLLSVSYGFDIGNGKTVKKQSFGDSTPWHKVDFPPNSAIAVLIFAQAADPMATLVCVIYQGAVQLSVVVGANDGKCSALADI